MNSYLILTAAGGVEMLVTSGIAPLEQLQKAVGGYIEAMHVDLNGVEYDAFCNEEGKILEPPLPVNKFYPDHNGDIILGHVDEEGDFLGITPEDLRTFPAEAIAGAGEVAPKDDLP